jgi:hypothetical protein
MELFANVSGRKVKFTSLDEVIPSTITAIIKYSGEINLYSMFVSTIFKKKKELKEERNDDFRIVAVRYGKETRGKGAKLIIEEEDHFKGSVTISIRYKGQRISIKLAKKNFHICGLKTVESGEDIVKELIKEIKKNDELIENIKNNHKKYSKLIEQIKSKTVWRHEKVKFLFKIVSKDDDELKFSNMIFEYSNYCLNLEQYHNSLDKLIELNEPSINLEPQLNECSAIMIDYIYSIGKQINRWKLACIINSKTDSSFKTKYNNSTQHFIRIKVPFNDDEFNLQQNKKKRGKHQFFIHRTGTISQTGLNYPRMKLLFEELIQIIRENYTEIIDLDMGFLLEN